jgi:hypothetical protein
VDIFARVGPEGLLLVQALVVSVLVAALAWRRVAFTATAIATAIAALVPALWLSRSAGTSHPLLVLLFAVVPSALLLGASRTRWVSHHAWLLALLGPFVFVGCFVGICELCVKTGLI